LKWLPTSAKKKKTLKTCYISQCEIDILHKYEREALLFVLYIRC
jgi:hypothetical protein